MASIPGIPEDYVWPEDPAEVPEEIKDAYSAYTAAQNEAAELVDQAKAEALQTLLLPTTGTTVASLRATVEKQRQAYLTLLGQTETF